MCRGSTTIDRNLGIFRQQSQFFSKVGPAGKSLEKQIQSLAVSVGDLVYKCNEVYRAKNSTDLFKATNETTKGLQLIANPIKDRDSYGNFVDALYKVIYEGSGSGIRLGSALPVIVEDIKTFRTDLRHDVDHGKQSKIKAKEKGIAEAVKRYTEKLSVQLLGEQDFMVFQFGLLDGLKKFLETLYF